MIWFLIHSRVRFRVRNRFRRSECRSNNCRQSNAVRLFKLLNRPLSFVSGCMTRDLLSPFYPLPFWEGRDGTVDILPVIVPDLKVNISNSMHNLYTLLSAMDTHFWQGGVAWHISVPLSQYWTPPVSTFPFGPLSRTVIITPCLGIFYVDGRNKNGHTLPETQFPIQDVVIIPCPMLDMHMISYYTPSATRYCVFFLYECFKKI